MKNKKDDINQTQSLIKCPNCDEQMNLSDTCDNCNYKDLSSQNGVKQGNDAEVKEWKKK